MHISYCAGIMFSLLRDGSFVHAAYASFLWEQGDDLGEGEQDVGGAPERAARTGQVRELAPSAV